MSFPTIPDINPKINVTKEDAIALLLTSIALEEISLSELIDAETKKVKFIVGECGSKKASIQDLKDINRSVNQTIKDVIKLQMLLQFKLENVLEIVCTTTSTSTSTTTTSTSTTTTMTTTTASTTSCPTTTAKRKCECSLTGRGQGCVSNPNDQFFGGTAVLQACVCELCGCIKDSLLCYSVMKGTILETLIAFSGSLIIECPSEHNPNRIVIKGVGTAVRKEGSNNISEIGSFILTVWDDGAWLGADSFQMIITVEGKPEFNHDSGVVSAKNSDLIIRICPN